MYEWKRERRKPSKPVGPSKKQLTFLLAELNARVSDIYHVGMEFSQTSKERAVMAGGQWCYLDAIKQVEHALFVGERHSSWERAAHLAKHVAWLAGDVASKESLLNDGYYTLPNAFMPEVPAEVLKAKALGRVEGAREVLELFAGIGVVPREKGENAA